MLDRIRLPFFIIAGIALLLAVGLEMGSSMLPVKVDPALMRREADRQLPRDLDDRDDVIDNMVSESQKGKKPPGMGIRDLGIFDLLILYTAILMAAALIIPEKIHGRIQGIVSLIVGIVGLLGAIVLFIEAFVKLMIMVGLFLATPFGTIAYLAIWGSFNRGGAGVILTASLFLKLAFVILLFLAHQRFFQNKGLVLILLCSFLGNFIIALLHGFVPIFLVSITDAIGAIIAVILLAIWSILLIIGSIIAIVKAIV
jgi:hypothetical protein